MKENKLILYIKITTNFIIAILVTLFLIFALPKLIRFFLPFVIGWIVAMIANPLVHFLEKKVRILRKHSTAIILVLVIAIIIATSVFLVAILAKQVRGLANDFPNIMSEVQNQLEDVKEYIDKITEPLPDKIHKAFDNAIEGLWNSLTEFMSQSKPFTVDKAGHIVGNVAEGFLMVIVTILSAYFFAAGRNELMAGLKKIFPETAVSYWKLISDNFKAAFGGYFKAQFKIMFVITVIMFIGFYILRVGYSFLLALGIALVDVLPVLGTGAILWPWALVDMISGNYVRAVGLVVIYLVCQIVKQVLQPKMVGDSIGLHPLATLLFMYIGYKVSGVLGLIIGIPIGMVLVNMYRIGIFDRIVKGFKIIAHDINEFRKF